MLRLIALCCLVGPLLWATLASAQSDRQPVGGRLLDAVLRGAERFDLAQLPPDLPEADRVRLVAYARRRSDFKSRLGSPPPESGDNAPWMHGRRRAFEREMVAIVDRPGIEEDAAAAAAATQPPPPSGGTDPGRYAEEIAWAEAWLQRRGDSPFAPLFYAYIAWNLRAGIELNDDQALRERLARKYRTMLDRLRSQDDRIWRLLAEELDGGPRVTNAGPAHPRDYLPAG
jgi:hypothetical protein